MSEGPLPIRDGAFEGDGPERGPRDQVTTGLWSKEGAGAEREGVLQRLGWVTRREPGNWWADINGNNNAVAPQCPVVASRIR